MTDHRPQLRDDITDGKVNIKDLTTGQLKEMLTELTLDYNPTDVFWTMVDNEVRYRSETKRKTKKVDKGFFK